jgi:hypothetical protein
VNDRAFHASEKKQNKSTVNDFGAPALFAPRTAPLFSSSGSSCLFSVSNFIAANSLP